MYQYLDRVLHVHVHVFEPITMEVTFHTGGSASPCQQNEFQCISSNQCIAAALTCNEVNDCDDGSDEDEKLANCEGAICSVTTCDCAGTMRSVLYLLVPVIVQGV